MSKVFRWKDFPEIDFKKSQNDVWKKSFLENHECKGSVIEVAQGI